MNQIPDAAADRSRKIRKTLIATSLGALAGFTATFAFIRLTQSGLSVELGASREIAGLIAIMIMLMGGIVGFGALSPKYGAKVLNVEDAEEIGEQRSQFLLSAGALLLSGLAFMFLALAEPVGPLDRAQVLTFAIVATLLAAGLSILAKRQQDELMREVGRESSAMALALLTAIGGSWAVLAHLGYAKAPAPLDWLSMLWGLTLLAAFIAIGRRGMLLMR